MYEYEIREYKKALLHTGSVFLLYSITLDYIHIVWYCNSIINT